MGYGPAVRRRTAPVTTRKLAGNDRVLKPSRARLFRRRQARPPEAVQRKRLFVDAHYLLHNVGDRSYTGEHSTALTSQRSAPDRATWRMKPAPLMTAGAVTSTASTTTSSPRCVAGSPLPLARRPTSTPLKAARCVGPEFSDEFDGASTATGTPSLHFRTALSRNEPSCRRPPLLAGFWTWQSREVSNHVETDVYECYSDNHRRLYLTQHSGVQGRCGWQPTFDATTDWHTYASASHRRAPGGGHSSRLGSRVRFAVAISPRRTSVYGEVHVVRVVAGRVPLTALVRPPAGRRSPDLLEPDHVQNTQPISVADVERRQIVTV